MIVTRKPVRRYDKWNFILWEETHVWDNKVQVMQTCRTMDPTGAPGLYIGSLTKAMRLAKRGIRFANERVHADSDVCCIGFNEDEQKWYGWSHRAIYGYGVGHTVEPGHVAYMPEHFDDFVASSIRFLSDEGIANTDAIRRKDEHGKEYIEIETASGFKLRSYLPERWGRGSWTAKTLEDAKQMAIHHAIGAS